MANPTYLIEILDKSLQPITSVAAFVPLNTEGEWLSYSTRLSDSGQAKLRIATTDPILTKYGDILKPWSNSLRIKKNGTVVWQGYIQDLPQRNKKFIEVHAYSYMEQLKKVLVPHDPITVDGEDIKNFTSGTMYQAIEWLVNQVQANTAGLAIQGLTLGDVQNPLFPANFTNNVGTAIGGQPWTFSSNFSLKFDFVDIHYVLSAFGIYSAFDWEVDQNLKLNFRKRQGIDRPELVFEYGQWGMIDDFNAPLDGKNQANKITGVASDNADKLIKLNIPQDDASIALYGPLQGVAAYNDVKNLSLLSQRLSEELRLNSTPDTELRLVLNDRAYPLGQYNLGDVATFRIKYGAINYDGLREITGIQVNVHNNGNEKIQLSTNKPRIKV